MKLYWLHIIQFYRRTEGFLTAEWDIVFGNNKEIESEILLWKIAIIEVINPGRAGVEGNKIGRRGSFRPVYILCIHNGVQ